MKPLIIADFPANRADPDYLDLSREQEHAVANDSHTSVLAGCHQSCCRSHKSLSQRDQPRMDQAAQHE